MQLLKEKLCKSEQLVQQLYKEIKKLKKSQPGRPAKGLREPQGTKASVKQDDMPEMESFELWSETGNNNIVAEPSNMVLRRIPKHMSFLDSFFKDTDPATLEMEKDDGRTPLSEIVQAEINLYGTSSAESEARYTLDLKTDQSQDLCHLTHASSGGIGVCKTSVMPSDLSKGKEHERAAVLRRWQRQQQGGETRCALFTVRQGVGEEETLLSSFFLWCILPSICLRTPRTPMDTGFLKITTVNCKGKFVRILNTSLDQDVDLSGFIIQQWIGGYPVSIYRFPPDTTLPALHHVTVWAAADCTHKKPADVTRRTQLYFRTGPECTTVLSNAKGQTLSRYTAPHRLTAAANAYTDNTDLSVDKFPLAGEGEEAEEPLPQKDQHWVPAAPHRGSTGRPLAVLQKARDRKHFPSNSNRRGDPSKGGKRKIQPTPRETVHKTVSFSAQNLPTISVAVKEKRFSSSEEEEEDFAPYGRQLPTAEPKPRVFKTALDTTIPTVALIGQKSARSKYGFKHMAYLPTTTDMQLRRYCPAR
ncbi:lamin tail domain-containing protein 2 [Pangshura tecta]